MEPTSLQQQKTRRRALIGSIVVASIAVHVVMLLLFGIWTVAKHFSRTEARFEVKKVVRIPPRTPEHRMNVARHEAMSAPPALSSALVSTRPTAFALPELPRLDASTVQPLDPTVFLADQVSVLASQAGMGWGSGGGLGAGGKGGGISFFGVEAGGERVLLLFDVSASVVNKANQSGVPLEHIKQETIRLIEGLPLRSQFSLIQFTGNYLPFTGELVAATPGNKKQAKEWVEQKWVTSGSMTARRAGVVQNYRGVVGVLELALAMKPEVVFLLSDASFQWRAEGGGGFRNIPDQAIDEVIETFSRGAGKKIPIQFIAFQPKEGDAKSWKKWVRQTGGEFREIQPGDE